MKYYSFLIGILCCALLCACHNDSDDNGIIYDNPPQPVGELWTGDFLDGLMIEGIRIKRNGEVSLYKIYFTIK